MSTRLTLGRVWLIECQRCANSDYSFEDLSSEARNDFASMGWADDFCPACNGVMR